jgi:hypothetical protein
VTNIVDETIAVSDSNRSVVADDAVQGRHIDAPPFGAFSLATTWWVPYFLDSFCQYSSEVGIIQKTTGLPVKFYRRIIMAGTTTLSRHRSCYLDATLMDVAGKRLVKYHHSNVAKKTRTSQQVVDDVHAWGGRSLEKVKGTNDFVKKGRDQSVSGFS